MTFRIGDRVREARGQHLAGIVTRVWQDIHGHCYRVAFDMCGAGCGGDYYGKDLVKEG